MSRNRRGFMSSANIAHISSRWAVPPALQGSGHQHINMSDIQIWSRLDSPFLRAEHIGRGCRCRRTDLSRRRTSPWKMRLLLSTHSANEIRLLEYDHLERGGGKGGGVRNPPDYHQFLICCRLVLRSQTTTGFVFLSRGNGL